MTEIEQLAQVCERLGATRTQAETMARQLLKRAGQIAVERGVAPEVALQGLLEVVIKGRAGEVPGSFLTPSPGEAKPD